MQETFDWLYKCSVDDKTMGIDLYNIIQSEQNILLAYRMIKSNTGSKTKGTDGLTIDDYKIQSLDDFICMIRNELSNYKPSTIRRVEIPKANGKTRPLGIPTMKDRLIQQMIKQVIEPICEAKFYKHSYGFRPLRATSHAIARCNMVMHLCQCHHVVDIDIKSFFDYVNHNKLIKQLYTIGIKDKRVLAIIAKMLKAPIKGMGIPLCGTPQGGILSPLLSNVVLNDLDWWVANQWETFSTKHTYSNVGKTHRALKTTKLKEMHIVRYADDFKIFTTTSKDAWKIFHAVKGYLRNQLHLDVSKEKTKVTNLRRRFTEFLGFELKVAWKRKKFVSISRMSRKSKQHIKMQYRKLIKSIQKKPSASNSIRFNSFVLGVHEYYSIATHVNHDFSKIYYQCKAYIFNRLRTCGKYAIPRSPPAIYESRYSLAQRTYKVGEIYLFPLANVQWKLAFAYKPKQCIFSTEGRRNIHEKLDTHIQQEIDSIKGATNPTIKTEFHDNRISRYSMQHGRCYVTGVFLKARELHCHHILPKSHGGTDVFDNLIIVHEWVHKLIHAIDRQTIEKYVKLLNITKSQKQKLNKLRTKCNLTELI